MTKKFNTKRLCTEAVLAALYVVFDMLATNLSAFFGGNIKISLSGLAVTICAILYGPVSGMLVGLVGAFAGQMLTYGFSATTLLWILPAGVRGLLAGVLFIAFGRSLKFRHIVIQTVISSFVITILNTVINYIDSLIYQYPYAVFAALSLTRFAISAVTAVVYSLILIPVIKALKKYV